ncbi:Rint-1 family protein [Mycena sanguinolenta]|uniref:Rint-1 family protein n=1 Tax=Mycena sanguinolenta TaxID=230812 RepID=A0A8H6ZCV3_9AGAR|nr:Rint-1 family protein [Mycena sanguinolenta]
MASLIQALLLIATGLRRPLFLTGNLKEIYNFDAWDFHHKLGEKCELFLSASVPITAQSPDGGVVRIDGMLGTKELYVFDPRALYQIMVKDQDIFEETDSMIRGTRLMFGDGILSTLGATINICTCGFSSCEIQPQESNTKSKGRGLTQFSPLLTSDTWLRAALESRVKQGPKEVDLLLWMTRTALELVGQAGLGYSFDPLETDEIPPYIVSVKQLGVTMHKMALSARYLMPLVAEIGSAQFRRFMVNIVPWKNLHETRDILDTLYATAVDIYNLKKAALEAGDKAVSSQIAEGKDIISILMKENVNASSDERLSEDEIIGQLNTLVFAATDTTSSALSRTLHILAERPDAQEKLRKEIRLAGVDITYDQLNSMEWLDAVCRETLRLYPPVSYLSRITRKDVILTTSTPVTTLDGSTTTEIPIPAETNILVSLLGSNRNPAIWGTDVLEWKPERWLSPLPQSVADAHVPGIYSNLMTFNAGGRACIGFKFSQLEMKVILCLLVERFKFSLSDKDVAWQMSPIAVPAVEGTKPQLPLKVELAV